LKVVNRPLDDALHSRPADPVEYLLVEMFHRAVDGVVDDVDGLSISPVAPALPPDGYPHGR